MGTKFSEMNTNKAAHVSFMILFQGSLNAKYDVH